MIFGAISGSFLFLLTLMAAGGGKIERKLSRPKRFLTFPEGTTFSASVCLTVQALGPAQIFTEAIAWGINYDLPNDTSIFKKIKTKKPTLQRRYRRDLYQKLEKIMNSLGLEGRSCILKTLCEVGQTFRDRRSENVLEEIVAMIFRFPTDSLTLSEPDDHWQYHLAYEESKQDKKGQNIDCTKLYWQCQISISDLLFKFLSN